MKQTGKPALWSMLLTAAILFTMTILPGIIRNKAVSSLEQATGNGPLQPVNPWHNIGTREMILYYQSV
jgi:hypothetical protein